MYYNLKAFQCRFSEKKKERKEEEKEEEEKINPNKKYSCQFYNKMDKIGPNGSQLVKIVQYGTKQFHSCPTLSKVSKEVYIGQNK